MRMYTELVFGGMLIGTRYIPPEVIRVLDYICNGVASKGDLPDHPLFDDGMKWDRIGNCDSYYFGAHAHSSFVLDNVTNQYRLSIRCNIKNYSNEIELFIDWIKPYMEKGAGSRELLGYFIYEEANEPTLIYLKEEKNEEW